MTRYSLYAMDASMVSRGRATAAWAEADRIEALVLQTAYVGALKEIG